MEKLELPTEVPPGLPFKLGMAFATHPIEVSKVLIQIGHEPISPRQTKTLMGKPALALPSIFQYCGYIRKKEGWTGLWRGVTPRLYSLAVQAYTGAKFDELVPPEPELSEEEEAKLTDEEKWERFAKATIRDISSRIVCVVASQPLQVISIRAIAEFVGSETNYTGGFTGGIVNGFKSVVNENGLFGLWSGLVPRLVGEISLLSISSTLTFLVNNYVMQDAKEMHKYTGQFANFIAQSITYPMQVVGACMIVSRSGVAAGYPPFMPLYGSWTDCFAHLRSQGQLKRGSSVLFRYYTGPQVLVGDRMMPVSSKMLKSPLSSNV